MKEALRYAAAALGELRTSLLAPPQYFELYLKVVDELSPLDAFFAAEPAKGRPLADLYELVQHAGNVLPRLYLLCTARVKDKFGFECGDWLGDWQCACPAPSPFLHLLAPPLPFFTFRSEPWSCGRAPPHPGPCCATWVRRAAGCSTPCAVCFCGRTSCIACAPPCPMGIRLQPETRPTSCWPIS